MQEAAGDGSGSAVSSLSSATAAEGSSNPCPICLESIKDEAYLDRCFHTFCYSCITQWTKIVSRKHSESLSSIRCPLCKSENFSILHDLSGSYFRQHFVNQDENSFFSKGHIFRWQCYCRKAGILNNKVDIPLYWKSRRYLKRNVWVESWLRREIQTLTQEKDVDIIVHHILGVVHSFFERELSSRASGSPEKKREEFKLLLFDAARPFVLERAERFVDELELFLASGLNIEAYDKLYIKYLAIRIPGSSSHCNEAVDQEPVLNIFDEDMEKTV